MKLALILGILFSIGTQVAHSQFPQRDRYRDRRDRSVQASEAREHDRRLEESMKLPTPRKAVMNVDVQMVLSKADYKTFAEAKAAEAKKLSDGEPVWMYVKFNGKLGDYVLTTRSSEDREKLNYTLFAEVAPRGDVTALHQVTLQFTKEDLVANELKINLAPGIFGRNKSIPVFLLTAGAAKTGVWNNEIRLTNTVAMPRALTDNLASAAVIVDLSAGTGKYQKMDADYGSIIIRGTNDVAKLPVPGTFFSEALSTAIAARLATENISPLKIYFSGDDWLESASFSMGMKKSRKVSATFTYRIGESCLYGVAEVVEKYDLLQSAYGEREITLQKDIPVACEKIS